jgi:hypothetical protein
MDGFKLTRESLKLDQGVEVAANVDDADAITLPEKITASRYVPLDEKYAEPLIQGRAFKAFRREPNIQHGSLLFMPLFLAPFGLLQPRNDARHFPNVIRHASGHPGGSSKRLMNAGEIIVHHVKRNWCGVLDFLAAFKLNDYRATYTLKGVFREAF